MLLYQSFPETSLADFLGIPFAVFRVESVFLAHSFSKVHSLIATGEMAHGDTFLRSKYLKMCFCTVTFD